MMKRARVFKRLTILSCLCVGSVALAAGGMEGGGGKTVVCRNPDGSIRSTEVLDLYEGRVVYQLSYQEAPHEWQTQARDIMRAAGIHMAQSWPPSGINDWFVNAVSHLTFLPAGTALKPVDDSFEVIAPVGCEVEQTVNYQNDRLILVSGEIWNALSETQRAALIIHESVYRYLRAHGERDSRRARHFTAHIVSGGRIEDIFPGNDYDLLCSSPDGAPLTFFYAFKLPLEGDPRNQKVRLQFGALGGRWLMSPAYDDFLLYSDDGPDLLAQLKNPSQWVRYQSIVLSALFEAGDSIDLWFHRDQDGKWVTQILGASIVDGSPIKPVNITCFDNQKR